MNVAKPAAGPSYLGIDAGGSRVRWRVLDGEGHEIARGEAEGSRSAREGMVEAARQAQPRGPFAAAFAGVAGVVTPAERAAVVQQLQPILPGCESLTIDHDLRVAHAGAYLGDDGVLLLSGTGSCCYAEVSGRQERVGGLGPFLDDDGSGFDIGRAALRAVVRHLDGRGPSTRLIESLHPRGAARGARELSLRAAAMSRREVAALARDVVEAYEEGDPVAEDILRAAASALAAQAVVLVSRLELPSPRLCAVGGVGGHPVLQELLRTMLAGRVTGPRWCHPHGPPVLGAAWLALRSQQPGSAERVRERWIAAGPPPSAAG